MIPVYDYWDWYTLISPEENWRYFHPEDDYATSRHYDSLEALVSSLAEDHCDNGGVEGIIAEVTATSKDGPPHKIYVDLESWCRHYEPEFLA